MPNWTPFFASKASDGLCHSEGHPNQNSCIRVLASSRFPHGIHSHPPLFLCPSLIRTFLYFYPSFVHFLSLLHLTSNSVGGFPSNLDLSYVHPLSIFHPFCVYLSLSILVPAYEFSSIYHKRRLSLCRKKSCKVLLMMKAAKLGWAGKGAGKQGWSRSRAEAGTG